MSDLVERLRAPAYWMSGSSEGHEGENDAPREAADEITRLMREVARKDAALQTAANAFRTLEEVAVAQLEHDKARNFIKLGDKCRAALKEQQP